MMYFIIGVVVYVVWTIVGLVFFFNTMGYKFRKQRWYDIPLLIPVMPIANILSWMNRK
jgi:hypothetical protein